MALPKHNEKEEKDSPASITGGKVIRTHDGPPKLYIPLYIPICLLTILGSD